MYYSKYNKNVCQREQRICTIKQKQDTGGRNNSENQNVINY